MRNGKLLFIPMLTLLIAFLLILPSCENGEDKKPPVTDPPVIEVALATDEPTDVTYEADETNNDIFGDTTKASDTEKPAESDSSSLNTDKTEEPTPDTAVGGDAEPPFEEFSYDYLDELPKDEKLVYMMTGNGAFFALTERKDGSQRVYACGAYRVREGKPRYYPINVVPEITKALDGGEYDKAYLMPWAGMGYSGTVHVYYVFEKNGEKSYISMELDIEYPNADWQRIPLNYGRADETKWVEDRLYQLVYKDEFGNHLGISADNKMIYSGTVSNGACRVIVCENPEGGYDVYTKTGITGDERIFKMDINIPEEYEYDSYEILPAAIDGDTLGEHYIIVALKRYGRYSYYAFEGNSINIGNSRGVQSYGDKKIVPMTKEQADKACEMCVGVNSVGGK